MLRLIVISFIVLHSATAGLEVYAFRAGLSASILANVAVRVLAVALFASLGLRRPRSSAVEGKP